MSNECFVMCCHFMWKVIVKWTFGSKSFYSQETILSSILNSCCMVLLEDRQKRKDVCSFYTPYGCSLGFKMSSSKYTNSLCGRLRGGPASPLTPFATGRAGGAAAAIYWSFCSFYKVFSFFYHPFFGNPLFSTISQQIIVSLQQH